MSSVVRLVTFASEEDARLFDQATGIYCSDRRTNMLRAMVDRVEGDPDEVVSLREFLGDLKIGALAAAVRGGMPGPLLNERRPRRKWAKLCRKQGLL